MKTEEQKRILENIAQIYKARKDIAELFENFTMAYEGRHKAI